MKKTFTVQITEPSGAVSNLQMNLEKFEDMNNSEYQIGLEDYGHLLVSDVVEAIADLEKQWEDG